MNTKITFLNHASVIIELGNIKLLTDPWFGGNCFEAGWGLRFDTPFAMEEAAKCTHLWISHFHCDHFHGTTLRKLLELNPNIHIFGNHSYNFRLDEAIKRIGFKNVTSMAERKTYVINDEVSLTRYPSTGIDNMLLINYKGLKILNYNDCNLPAKAQKWLKNKLGHIDILLNNFNVAYKTLDYPLPTTDEVRASMKSYFLDSSMEFEPNFILPFASYHYFKVHGGWIQNDWLMSISDLVELDSKVVDFRIGDTWELSKTESRLVSRREQEVKTNSLEQEPAKPPTDLGVLADHFRLYARRLNRAFFGMTYFIKPLLIRLEDIDKVVSASLWKGLVPVSETTTACHIVTTTEGLRIWFCTHNGTDSFMGGAHFSVDQASVPIGWQLLLGLLTENKLDLLSMLKMIFTPSGLKFLINRREEILAILLGKRFRVGLRR